MRTARLSLVVPFLLVSGCGSEAPQGIAPKPDGAAPFVPYGELDRHLGKRVSTRAWVLGEGRSFKIDDRFYNLLIPEPQIDWAALVDDLAAAETLAGQLNGRGAERADADAVNEYGRLEQAAREWSLRVGEQEAAGGVTCWGKFRRNVLAAEYSAVPDAPAVLVNPTREDLRKAAQNLLSRLGQLASSVELEVSGRVLSTTEWAKGPGVPEGEALSEITRRPLLMEVDTIRVLRTGRDAGAAAEGRQGGAARLVEPRVD